MKDFFNRFILGPAPSSLQKEKSSAEKRIYFTEVFSIISAFVCIPYAVIYFYYQHYTIGFTVLLFSAAFLLSTVLNRKHYYDLSKNIFILTSNIAIFVYSLLLGKETGVYFLFIAACSGVAVIFPVSKRLTIFYHFITSIALFIILEVVYSYDINFFPIAGTVKYLLYLTSYGSTLLMVFICNFQQNSINEEAEDSLRKNQERSVALLNAIPDLMFRINTKGRVLDYNSKKNLNLSKVNGKEIGNTMSIIFPEALSEKITHIAQRVISNNSIESLEFEHLLDATPIHLEARFVKSGKDEVTVIVREFTEQKKIELQLKWSETNLKVIFENTIQAFLLVGRDREILAYNTKARNIISGISGRVINIGERLFETPETQWDYFMQSYQKALNGEASKREIEIKLANGEKVFTEVGHTPAYDKNGAIYGVLINAMDIVERKKHELELEKAKDMAEAAAKAKSEFLSNMSHEIRTPLNAIVGFTDLLLQEKLNENIHESIEAIKYSSENLQVLINDILDLAKIDAGKVTLENIDFNLKNLLSQTTNLIKVKALDKGIQFNYTIDETIPANLVGDPVRLNQIILNLTSNAVKFTNKGSVHINVSTTFKSKQQIILKISVKDTGIGIREDQLENIFNSFTQAENYITRKYGGTGLGLSITKKLVELNKGEITIQSVLNQGSEFIVELPFKISKKINLDQEKLQQDYTQLKGVKVLLAEDNNFNLLLLSKILNKWGIEIDIVTNGIEALDLLKKKQYDLVLMDIQMPEMTGLEATQYIRKEGTDVLNPKIPVIAISADAYNESKSIAMNSGMTDYITKPFKQQELFEILIKNLIGHSLTNSDHHREEGEKLYSEESPVLDIDYLRDHIASDESVLQELLSLYLQTTALGIEKLDHEFQIGNKEGIKTIAHKMKSSFLSIGYKRTSKLLMLVEKNEINNSNKEFFEKLIKLIRSDFEKSEEAIKKILSN